MSLTDNLPTDLNDPALYINRETSLLEFQYRVLEEAKDESNPILERLKFLSIVDSNLDEFCMVRIGGLKKQIAGQVVEASFDGRTPTEVLFTSRKRVHSLMESTHGYLLDVLIPALDKEGVHIVNYDQLSERHHQELSELFDEEIFPVLTPLAIDFAHPFPHISNLSLNLAVLLEDYEGAECFARVKVPSTIDRLLLVERGGAGVNEDSNIRVEETYVWVEQVISANLGKLFPGMKIRGAWTFRVTRNADMTIQEIEADDLLETMEEGVRQRRMGSVLRLTIINNMPGHVRDLLKENLQTDSFDVYEMKSPLGLKTLMEVYSVSERLDLKFPAFVPFTSQRLKTDGRDRSLFEAIRTRDYLLHHPYDSFSPVIDFLNLAATDPSVMAIKMTLYRVGSNSPVVKALLRARENGKQVAVLVELKARFDETSNIGWAKLLEREGVHVTYGVLDLKAHLKIALVIRKQGANFQRYLHLSTGNYNAVTAHLYEDIGFFTKDSEMASDATDVFNILTGYSDKRDFKKLLVAPRGLRARLEGLINREIKIQKQGGQGRMILKTNALVDKLVIKLLYKASMAGVRIGLLVRGICCLRPGIPGLSDNITVTSIVGRFLEHSRLYYFRNGGKEEIYMGSADLMPRNLSRRVEILFPIHYERLRRYLIKDVLEMYLRDNVKARRMESNGGYKRIQPQEGEEAVNVQEYLLTKRAMWAETEMDD